MNWSKYPNFTEKEMCDPFTHECAMNQEFMAILQSIRTKLQSPMIITSGYRSKNHPRELVKPAPGEHTYGMAADIHATGLDALQLVQAALEYGIRRIGVNQKGEFSDRYIHLGIGDRYFQCFIPGIWTY